MLYLLHQLGILASQRISMTAPTKLNFKMYQGSTFTEVIRWESSTKVYKPITSITKAAPVVITANSHGIPLGWRTKVTNAGGMTQINDTENYYQVTGLTTNSITINSVNSLGYGEHTANTGVLEYNEPVPLVGFTARMQLRPSVTSVTIIDQYTTENGIIVLDTALSTITIAVPATQTAGYGFSTAVYSLELVGGTQVYQLITGTITLVQEVTR